MKRKVIPAADVVAMIPEGASLMVGGFMGVGTPPRLVDELVRQGKTGLTLICNDTARPGVGVGVGKLITAGLVRKLLTSHIGTNPETQRAMLDGKIEVTLVPQGTLAERIRAGGVGLGAILNGHGFGGHHRGSRGHCGRRRDSSRQRHHAQRAGALHREGGAMSLDAKNLIARRVAQELQDGDCVNLGIGLPTLVADYVPAGIHVFFHSENGIMGVTPLFGIIRGGHPDITVLGGLEVDETGQLANWMVPGKMVPGMGGAMDLVTGAKRVIVAMTHRSPSGSKIVRRCSLPIASTRRVDLVVTELGVIRPTDDGLLLIETLPGVSAKDVQAASDAPLMLATGLA